MKRAPALAVLTVLAAPLAAQSWCARHQADTGYVALIGVTLWDGTGGAPRPGRTILIHGERIAGVFRDGGQGLPPGTTVRPATGKYVIPGLLDGHVHLATDPSGEDTRLRTERRLCRALLGGITAVRDMAGDVRELASLQRDARVGDIASPDLYYAALWAGPAFFADPRTASSSAGAVPGTLPWMRAIDSTTNLPQAVAEARGTGATAIKLYAALTPALVDRITAEAHRQGLLVWAHAAMAQVSPREMAEAGVNVLSHASLLLRQLGSARYAALVGDSTRTALTAADAATLDSLAATMRQDHTLFEPTLFIYDGERKRMLGPGGWVTRLAQQGGVPIVAGTDSMGSGDDGVWQLPNLHQELALLVRVGGLSSGEALTAATRYVARAVGADSLRGTVEAGKLADLVVLDADPIADIANTRTIRWVVKRGAFYPGGPMLVP